MGQAQAQSGINLSWDDCGAYGTESKTFACNTNAGSSTMVVTFAAPPGIACAQLFESVIDLPTSGDALPDWWLVANGVACRPDALQVSTNFVSGPASCADYWEGAGVAGYAYQVGQGGPNRVRIGVTAFSPSLMCFQPQPGLEYYLFRLELSHIRTVGVGACPGCGDGACMVLNEIRMDTGAAVVVLTNPLSRNHVVWQAGIPNCPAATPTRDKTWGAVKSLYR